MTVPLDIPTSLALGHAFILAAHKRGTVQNRVAASGAEKGQAPFRRRKGANPVSACNPYDPGSEPGSLLPFKLGLAYQVLVFCPVTGWFYLNYPDWMWAYLFDPAVLGRWGFPLVMAAYAGSYVAGARHAQYALARGRPGLAWAGLVLSLLATGLVFAFQADAYLHPGTRAEYLAGQAPALMQSGAFLGQLNLAGAVLAAPALAILGWLAWTGGRVADRS